LCTDLLRRQLVEGVTSNNNLLKTVFDLELMHNLPESVIPVSTSLPSDLATLFASELESAPCTYGPMARECGQPVGES
jgi:hypothetical protein